MSIARILIPAIALLLGGWFVFDGTRALRKGDYLTAKSGPRAGQLGPWSHVINAVGLDPRSTAVKVLHVLLGLFWLFGLALFLARPALGWWLLAGTAAASLWYLPLGTLLSLVELALLLTPLARSLK